MNVFAGEATPALEKAVRKADGALKSIRNLKAQQAQGKTLEKNQLEKLARENALKERRHTTSGKQMRAPIDPNAPPPTHHAAHAPTDHDARAHAKRATHAWHGSKQCTRCTRGRTCEWE